MDGNFPHGANPAQIAEPQSGRGGNAMQINRRADAADAWAGVSLGDALGPKRGIKNRYGAPEDTPPRVDEVRNRSNAQSSARHADMWEGASLGDVMGPRGSQRESELEPQSLTREE